MITDEFLKGVYFNNTGQSYIIAASIFMLCFGLLYLFKNIFINSLKKIAKKTTFTFDDMILEFIEDIPWFFYAFISFYAAAMYLILPGDVDLVLHKMMFIMFVFFITLAVNKTIGHFFDLEIKKRKEKDNKDSSLLKVMCKILQIFIWVIAILTALANLGINITSLIAGLGVGGIAVAFALQRILEDIFSSFSIYFDKPFEEGDFITIDNEAGTVEHIGIKSTRIRTLQGEELVISNKEMTTARIHNYKKMQKRRIVFTFGVEYDTSVEKIKKIKKIINDIFKKIDNAELDRAHFKTFGDFSLIFEIVYFINSRDYKVYMDTQERINLMLKEAFKKEKINFAYPTNTIILKK
ncbi:MAG: mechanosensitive ion channel family protein [Candidatus Woesearchaeota archaeon]